MKHHQMAKYFSTITWDYEAPNKINEKLRILN